MKSEQLGPTFNHVLLPLCVCLERMGQRCCLHFINGSSLVFPSSCIFLFFFFSYLNSSLIWLWCDWLLERITRFEITSHGFSSQACYMCVIVANHFLCVILANREVKSQKRQEMRSWKHIVNVTGLTEISYCGWLWFVLLFWTGLWWPVTTVHPAVCYIVFCPLSKNVMIIKNKPALKSMERLFLKWKFIFWVPYRDWGPC